MRASSAEPQLTLPLASGSAVPLSLHLGRLCVPHPLLPADYQDSVPDKDPKGAFLFSTWMANTYFRIEFLNYLLLWSFISFLSIHPGTLLLWQKYPETHTHTLRDFPKPVKYKWNIPQLWKYKPRFSKVWGLPGGTSGKECPCQCKRFRRHGFNPQVEKIPLGRT